MSKDLFEQQLGETLRKAESTPPAGAWEMIKSQIAVPYTPPFSFPKWTVVVISAIILGGLSFSDQGTDIQKGTTVATNSLVEKEPNNEPSVTQTQHEVQELTSQEVASSSLFHSTAENPEEVETLETSTEVLVEEKVLKEQLMLEQTDSKTNSTLPVQVELAQPLQAQVDQQATIEKPELNEPSVTIQESSIESKLSVEGANTCYTPCELDLVAEGNAEEYSWDAANFGLIEGKKLTLTIEEPQTLTVYALAKYKDGSERSLPRTIVVKEGSELFVPNSFTPNGDGVNDSYLVRGSGIESFSMSIINSKGKVVFQTSNINEAWNFDGSANDLENEYYTAIVRAIGIDGKVITKNERLTIKINP